MKYLFYILLFLPVTLFSQKESEELKVKLEDKQILRKGNDLFKEHKYVDAEVKYKKALKQNPNYENAAYNLGNSVYEQNRFKDALPQYEFVVKSTKDKVTKAQSFHNVGNSTMKLKQYDKAVAAFKNSLRLNPTDDETRYNLALAQKLLKDQQQQNKDKNKDNKDQDKNKDKNKDKNDQNKDQKKDEGDDKEKDKDQNKGDDNKDKKDQDKGNNEQKDKQQQKPKPDQLSQQQIQQLLEAMNNEENKTQKKVNAKKARGKKTKNEKDW